jgi:release factor glutamine methyltransferase
MTTTVSQALQWGYALVDRLDAQLLLAHCLQKNRAWLLAHDNDELAPEHLQNFEVLILRRAAHEPLAYIVGHKEFAGREFAVDARVLVPRPETEHLLEWALALLQDPSAPPLIKVADLGTGSGILAISLACTLPHLQVQASDQSAAALSVAQDNARQHQASVIFHQGSWWTPFVAQRFDLVISNPPYIHPQDPHLEKLGHEPLSALAAQDAGMADLRDIITPAPQQLNPGGWLLLEHGHDQGPAVRDLLHGAGFTKVSTRQDLAGLERCSGGQIPGSAQKPQAS